jgi:uncharacterized membrane protein YbhN (UPF0104 family)
MRVDWKTALGFGLSAALLWWTLRTTPIGDVVRVLRESDWLLFGLCTVVATCIFPLRARRWRTILEPTAGTLPFRSLWQATAIGMMINNVLPARAGEPARAFAINRMERTVPFTAALASLAVDRIFDALILFALMFGAMQSPAFPRGVTLLGRTVGELAVGGLLGLGAVLAVCWLSVLMPDRVVGVTRAVAHRIVPRFEGAIVAFVEHALGGLAVLKDGRRFLAVAWWALLHWLVHALALFLGFMAVGIDVPFSSALFVQGVLGIGVAVPSSPGFVGVFEASAVLGLGVYGVPESLALSWAIGYHLLSFIPITVFGAVYLARLGIGVGDIRRAAAREEAVHDATVAFEAPGAVRADAAARAGAGAEDDANGGASDDTNRDTSTDAIDDANTDASAASGVRPAGSA